METIPYQAFDRTAITNIVLPKSLKEIGDYAFQYAPLANIDIPEGVTTIGKAFPGCPLKTITLPSTLEYIGGEAFYYTQEEYNSSTRKYEYSYVLEDVYCKSVVPLATTTFNSEMSKGATLHVPAFSVSAYKLDDNWYMFGKVEALDGNLQDITINNDFTIVDYTGLADKPNLTITSTSTESSSSSSITAGHLTVSGSAELSLGEFVQKQERYEEKDYVYDENGRYSYVYTYPYCTTLIPNNEMRADAVTTKISMPTDMWSFISLPYDVSVADIEVPGNTMWVVRKYNGENRAAMSGDTWQNVESGQTLNAGEGYIFHCVSTDDDSDGYVEFTFPAVNNSNKNNVFAYADVTTTLNEYAAEFSHNRGWNLVGNPYPCYYNSHNLEFSAPITIWNGSGYTAYSLADDEYVMSPNEAFFVQCPINGTSIKFAKEGRQHEYSNTAVDNNTRAKAVVDRHILNFVVSDGKYNDRARIVINDEAKAEYEIERDASKFFSSQSNVPQVYVVDNGVNYAIDERPIGTGTFSLGVRLGQEGQYTFSMNAKDFDGDALLTDNETGKITNLAKESYTFTAQSQAYENRFSVSISGSGITGIQHTNIDGQAFSLDGKTLTFNSNYGNVSIVSADGKTIYKGVPSSPITLQKGIYVVSTDNGSSKIAVK